MRSAVVDVIAQVIRIRPMAFGRFLACEVGEVRTPVPVSAGQATDSTDARWSHVGEDDAEREYTWKAGRTCNPFPLILKPPNTKAPQPPNTKSPQYSTSI